MRILVVEDDLEAQRYLVNGLKEAGHVVDDAADGEIGLTLALSRPYDVAIIDRMLPKMDGLKLVAEIREHGNAMPVLFPERTLRSRRPRKRPEGRRRRLSHQALRLRRTARPHRRADAPAPPASVKTQLQVGDLELDLLTRDGQAQRHRPSTCSPANSACSNI